MDKETIKFKEEYRALCKRIGGIGAAATVLKCHYVTASNYGNDKKPDLPPTIKRLGIIGVLNKEVLRLADQDLERKLQGIK